MTIEVETRAEFYTRIGVVPVGARFVESHFVAFDDPQREVDPSNAWVRAGGESYYAVERVSYRPFLSFAQEKFIAQKANISLGGNLQYRSLEEVRTLRQLQEYGVPVPRIYAVENATIYRDFILHDGMQWVRAELERTSQLPTQSPAFLKQAARLMELAKIARTLDNLGFHPLGFLGDIVFDADEERFYFIDGGFDSGDSGIYFGGVAREQLERLVYGDERMLRLIEEVYSS